MKNFVIDEQKHLNWFTFWQAKRRFLNKFDSMNNLSFVKLNEEYWHDIIYPEHGINNRAVLRDEVRKLKFSDIKKSYHALLIDPMTKSEMVITSFNTVDKNTDS